MLMVCSLIISYNTPLTIHSVRFLFMQLLLSYPSFLSMPPSSSTQYETYTRSVECVMCFTSVLLTKYLFQAFVIYNFFHLLLAYLGGERSLLILLHGRPPKDHLFPGRYSPFYLTLRLINSRSVYIFKHEMDASDPFTFLWLKRGILRVSRTTFIVRVLNSP